MIAAPNGAAPPLVQITGLHRRFGEVHAVRDLSFAFGAGEIFGFIGPNGAGKTTTMRILATLDEPSEGRASVAGLDTVEDAEAVRRRIGWMPDQVALWPDMTVHDYLDFFARTHRLRGPARRRALAEVIEFCQLGELRDRPVQGLSKGMRQRLGLARCIVHDPDLLILDEPSAGLDPRARIELRRLLQALAEQGKAILISSHILAELEELCHRVAIIELGALVAAGSIAEVRAQGEQRRRAVTSAAELEHAVLELRLAAPFAGLRELLAEQPELAESRIDGDLLVATRLRGGPESAAAVLRRLVQAGVPVCHFATRDARLEDVFLHLTEGKVQ